MPKNWTQGTDGSHWWGSVNFNTLFDSGSRFWITKGSDANRDTGFLFEDKQFNNFMLQSIHDGRQLRGCFHWLQASVKPEDQADFYLERYMRYHMHFPPVLDFEEPSVIQRGQQSLYAYYAEVWIDRVHRITGRKPIIYTAKWYTKNFDVRHISWMRQYPLWVASYPWIWTILSKPTMPSGIWDDWTIWQYSADNNNKGSKYGVGSQHIDLNWYPGTYEELCAWLNVETPAPPVIPPDTKPGEKTMYVIEMIGTLRVRRGPGPTYLQVGPGNLLEDPNGVYALPGEIHNSNETKNGWYKIDQGWISGTTRWTRITEVEDTPIPIPEPDPTFEQRLDKAELRLDRIDTHLGLK
jgi:GH25 family lysozyme M1 (1,4-beta-N-acetylmuramidase)